jgi:hypothetical protein
VSEIIVKLLCLCVLLYLTIKLNQHVIIQSLNYSCGHPQPAATSWEPCPALWPDQNPRSVWSIQDNQLHFCSHLSDFETLPLSTNPKSNFFCHEASRTLPAWFWLNRGTICHITQTYAPHPFAGRRPFYTNSRRHFAGYQSSSSSSVNTTWRRISYFVSKATQNVQTGSETVKTARQ